MTMQNTPFGRPPRDRSHFDFYDTISTMTTNAENAIPSGADAPPDKTTKRNKKHPRRHGDRPRSKLCDKRNRRSPARAHKRTGSHLHGSLSPKYWSPKSSPSPQRQLCGKLWIRPVAARRPSRPFGPAWDNGAPRLEEVEEGGGNRNRVVPPFPPLDRPLIPPLDRPLVRQVTNSPVHDRETTRAWNPPFALLRTWRGTAGRARIAFGESGKPLRPRGAV